MKLATMTLLCVLLAACGGGGGDESDAPASTVTHAPVVATVNGLPLGGSK